MVALPAELPEWVMLIPAGAVELAAGRGTYQVDAPAVVAATLAALGDRRMPIDFDHSSNDPDGQPTPAAGWVLELAARESGIWARVEWTAAGADMIQGRHYPYISPTFAYPKGGNTVTRLVNAALVKQPAIDMPRIAAADNLKDPEMSLSEALRAALSLADDADDDAIVAAASQSAGEQAALHSRVTELEEQLAAASDAKPDPAKFVTIEDFNALVAKFAQLSSDTANDKATAAVEAASAAGKLMPAQRAWALEYAGRDLAGFEKYVAAAAVIVAPGKLQSSDPPPSADSKLTEVEEAARAAAGLTEEQWIAARPTAAV